jgi:hypothetical protein
MNAGTAWLEIVLSMEKISNKLPCYFFEKAKSILH